MWLLTTNNAMGMLPHNAASSATTVLGVSDAANCHIIFSASSEASCCISMLLPVRLWKANSARVREVTIISSEGAAANICAMDFSNSCKVFMNSEAHVHCLQVIRWQGAIAMGLRNPGWWCTQYAPILHSAKTRTSQSNDVWPTAITQPVVYHLSNWIQIDLKIDANAAKQYAQHNVIHVASQSEIWANPYILPIRVHHILSIINHQAQLRTASRLLKHFANLVGDCLCVLGFLNKFAQTLKAAL